MQDNEIMIPAKEISEILSDMSREVEILKKEVSRKGIGQEPLHKIANKLKNIAGELEELSKLDKYISEVYGKLKKKLEEQRDLLDRKNAELICQGINETVKLIEINLPDNMSLKKMEEDTWELYRVVKSDKNNSKKKGSNDIEMSLGKITLVMEGNTVITNVIIKGDCKEAESIRLESTQKIYPVVSYIRMHCDYKEY